MKVKDQSREELAASMGIDLSHLTEEEIEVNYCKCDKTGEYVVKLPVIMW